MWPPPTTRDVDAAVIQAAWADLQQLPTAWEPAPQPASHAATPASVVEFGSLSEEPAIAPTADEVEQPTELDEEPGAEPIPPLTTQPPLPLAPVRRPRLIAGPAAEAIDPFAEPFDEEELVLDSFATLASIFGTRAPRVENRREPAISQLVQDALDAFCEADRGPACQRNHRSAATTIRRRWNASRRRRACDWPSSRTGRRHRSSRRCDSTAKFDPPPARQPAVAHRIATLR